MYVQVFSCMCMYVNVCICMHKFTYSCTCWYNVCDVIDMCIGMTNICAKYTYA